MQSAHGKEKLRRGGCAPERTTAARRAAPPRRARCASPRHHCARPRQPPYAFWYRTHPVNTAAGALGRARSANVGLKQIGAADCSFRRISTTYSHRGMRLGRAHPAAGGGGAAAPALAASCVTRERARSNLGCLLRVDWGPLSLKVAAILMQGHVDSSYAGSQGNGRLDRSRSTSCCPGCVGRPRAMVPRTRAASPQHHRLLLLLMRL